MEYVEDTIETITVSVPSDFMWISMVNKGYVNAVESKIAELSGQNINLTYILKKRNSQKESESINSVPKTATIDSENSNISNENKIDSEKNLHP